jgi:hypothetical protein
LPIYFGKTEPQCQATLVKSGSPYEAICAGFADKFLIPTILHGQFPAIYTCVAAVVTVQAHTPSFLNTAVSVMQPKWPS